MRTLAALIVPVVVTVGCTSSTEAPDRIPPDHPAATVPEAVATFTLDLLNMQRDDPVVRFIVELDGELLVDQQVPYGENPFVERLPLLLEPGDHELVVTVGDESVSETVSIVKDSARFSSAMFWGDGTETMTAPPIDLTLSDEPIAYA